MVDENAEDSPVPDPSNAAAAGAADAQPTEQYPTLPLTPMQQTPVQQTPVQQTPVQQTPVQQTPVQQTPMQQTPMPQPQAQLPQPPLSTSASGVESSRRPRWLGWAIAGAVVALLMVSGGTAWAVSAAVSSANSPSNAATHHSATSAASGARGRHAGSAEVRHLVRGTIGALGSDTWTVKSAEGRTVTVSITKQTVFGTTAHPATRSDFAVGSKVAMIVTATPAHNGHLIAHRIASPHSSGSGVPSSTPSASV